MNKYRIMKDGRHVEDVEGEDARQVGMDAIDRHGNGMYDVSLIRNVDSETEIERGDGEDDSRCEECGRETEEIELATHGGMCAECFDISEDDDGEQ